MEISEPTKTAVTFGWRELCNEEFVIFTDYYCGVQVKDDEMGGACSMHCRLHTYELLFFICVGPCTVVITEE